MGINESKVQSPKSKVKNGLRLWTLGFGLWTYFLWQSILKVLS